MENPTESFVIGAYVVGAALASVTAEDAAAISHLFVAFGVIDAGVVVYREPGQLADIERIKRANPAIRVLLSVGGWGAGGFSEAAADADAARRFARSACELVDCFGFDGLDIDWEYPTCSVAGIAASAADRRGFTDLLSITRAELTRSTAKRRRDYLLTIAVGADQYFVDATDMNRVQDHVDLVNVMTYDMRGGFQILTGHHACLHPSTGDLYRISAAGALAMYERAGVPRAKLVMGAAFYARRWDGVPDRYNGLFQMAGTTGTGGAGYGELVTDYVDRNGFKRFWDDEAAAPFLFNGSTFISYDDPESIGAKCRHVRQHGYAGLFYWEHSLDPSRRLLSAIAEHAADAAT